jgi:transcriptional regulator with XRE-family HTH domain
MDIHLNCFEMPAINGRQPHPVDVHVGGRVRFRRMILGMSQRDLAKALNLTFQQVQKYEKGTNRIGSSRLFQLSKILEVPVSYFFADSSGKELDGGKLPANERKLARLLNSREGVDLVEAFTSISDPKMRQHILSFIKGISDVC